MNSPPSSSEQVSSSFDLLDARIQRWIWQKKWTALKDIQERAIAALLTPTQDVIIAAATASGKTEAAYFPILTRLAQSNALSLYVSPLKALINDQWTRLHDLCEEIGIAVTPWHGDIPAGRKRRFQKNPCGCLLITPESLEGILIRDGYSLSKLFDRLEYVVVDELHAFLDNERGKQLQSLMHRLESALGRRITRVGLSATLGDSAIAARFLRSEDSSPVFVIQSSEAGQTLKVMVKGYRERPPKSGRSAADAEATPSELGTGGQGHLAAKLEGIYAVAEDLYSLRGSNNLIFPNSRRNVELIADLLRERCEREHVPNEFWPHHGSLSRELREDAEQALKSGRPATAVATTTLELGIDIGAVKSIAQIGPAPSVASLRQRLGRSGRRAGEAAILRAYAIESELTPDSSLSDEIREGLLQTAAQIRLLLRRWCEPADLSDLHLSTLVQQLLSLIAQCSGVKAGMAWKTLCASGVFQGLKSEEFALLLRELAARDILQQESSGALLLGPHGERLVNHYTFLAAFVADEEFRIVTSGKTLGALPISRPLAPGSFVIFGGRRWRVLRCIAEDKIIEVEPAQAGQIPQFDGAGAQVHDEVRSEMRRILDESVPLPFLDRAAGALLEEARANYRRLQLDSRQVIGSGNQVRILTWRGDRVNDTLAVCLRSQGLSAASEGLSVATLDVSRERVIDALMNVAQMPPPNPQALAEQVQNLIREKWDGLLPEPLLRKAYGLRSFDIGATQELCGQIIADEP
jgi:ATP-dependent helicase Lhr and Lhr-like helicase